MGFRAFGLKVGDLRAEAEDFRAEVLILGPGASLHFRKVRLTRGGSRTASEAC